MDKQYIKNIIKEYRDKHNLACEIFLFGIANELIEDKILLDVGDHLYMQDTNGVGGLVRYSYDELCNYLEENFLN